MTDERILSEARRWKKLKKSSFPRVACQAAKRLDELCEEYNICEEDLEK